MTGLDRNQTPKTRPVDHKRTALVASLDIGTSKIACMIARLKPSPPSEATSAVRFCAIGRVFGVWLRSRPVMLRHRASSWSSCP